MVSILMSDLFRHSLNTHSSGTIQDFQETCNIYTYSRFRKQGKYPKVASNHYSTLISGQDVSLIFYIFFYNSITRAKFHFFLLVPGISYRNHNRVYENKKIIMTSSMASEINALGHQLNILSEKNRRSRDFTLISLIHTIREIIACFPVYRTYPLRWRQQRQHVGFSPLRQR